jgi:hypothetical protein
MIHHAVSDAVSEAEVQEVRDEENARSLGRIGRFLRAMQRTFEKLALHQG